MGPAQYGILSSPAVKAIILQEYAKPLAGMDWVAMLADRFPSNQATETYAGTGNVSAMRKWIGPKQSIPINSGSFTVTNDDYESTITLYEKDLDRDKTGQLKQKAAGLAIRGRQHFEKTLSALIDVADAATIGLAYDGQYFFDTDHSFGSSGTVNNDITFDVSTTTAPTPVELADAMVATVQAMYGFKDDQGEPANGDATDFIVMVPVTFWGSAQSAINLQFLANGISNRMKGLTGVTITPVCNQRLTWTTAFATFATNGVTKPFLIQEEVAPYLESTDRSGDMWFHEHKEQHSIVSRDSVFYQQYLRSCLTTLV